MLILCTKTLDYEGCQLILDKCFNIKIKLHKTLPSVQAKDQCGWLVQERFDLVSLGCSNCAHYKQKIGSTQLLEIISKPLEYPA